MSEDLFEGEAEACESAYSRVSRAVREVRARLRTAGVESADAEARALVSHAAQAARSLVLIDTIPDDFTEVLDALVSRREQHEPLQLILGRAPFRRIALEVRSGVFIPRPETEVAVDVVHEWLQEAEPERAASFTAVDACCGSGTLAAGILDECPGALVHAFDLNPHAVELSRTNLAAINGAVDRFSVAHAAVPQRAADMTCDDVLRAIAAPSQMLESGKVDLLVSNPPYIPANAIPRQPEVLEYDPHDALFGGGEDGMEIPSAVIELAAKVLADGGLLVMEHADVQGGGTRAMAEATGAFTRIRTVRDLTGKDRFLVAERAVLDFETRSERIPA